MTVKLKKFDPADFLDNEETISHYLDEAFTSNNPSVIASALGDVARARGMAKVAKDTGLSRQQLYKTLSGSGSPNLTTILKVMESLGVGLKSQPLPARGRKPARRATPSKKHAA